MRSRLIILIAALVLGVLAALTTAWYLNRAAERLEAGTEPVEVLVAKEAIPRGAMADELLDSGRIAKQEVPRRYVPTDAVSSPKALRGLVLAAPLSAGELVTTARFQLPTEAGLAYSVPNGLVAVAIPSDAVKGVAGLLKPGDFVMVTATFEPGPNGVEALTRVLLPKARVLAVGTDVGAQAPAEKEDQKGLTASTTSSQEQQASDVAPTVTLALTPADVEKLVFAEEQGSVWLALLPATETQLPVTAGRILQNLYE